jgi:hypothetical protein
MSQSKYSPDLYHKYEKALAMAENLDTRNTFSQIEEKIDFLKMLGINRIFQKTLGKRTCGSHLSVRIGQIKGKMERYVSVYKERFEKDRRENLLPDFNDGEQLELDCSYEHIGRPQVLESQRSDSDRKYLATRRR